jgi:transcriptional regulator with XRE-family HTH domain
MPRPFKNKLPPLPIGIGDIGERIAHHRKRIGLTQTKLANQIGISQTLLSDYETGRLQLSAEMVIRIAQTLGVRTGTLLGEETKNMPDNHSVSLKLVKRLVRMEQLSRTKQNALLQTIDGFLKGEGV